MTVQTDFQSKLRKKVDNRSKCNGHGIKIEHTKRIKMTKDRYNMISIIETVHKATETTQISTVRLTKQTNKDK